MAFGSRATETYNCNMNKQTMNAMAVFHRVGNQYKWLMALYVLDYMALRAGSFNIVLCSCLHSQ